MTRAPREVAYGDMDTETPTKMWNSFCDCTTFHLQQVFKYDMGETLKYYTTNT